MTSRKVFVLALVGALLAGAAGVIRELGWPSAPSLRADDSGGGGTPPDPRARAMQVMEAGFKWLVSKQSANGSFGAIPGESEPGEAGITGLALKAMAKAPGLVRSSLAEPMAKAAAYLLGLQQPDGSIMNPGSGLQTYRTAIGISALHAYDAKRFADAIKSGQSYLVSTQFSETFGLEGGEAKKSPYYGGWGYDRTGTKPDADISNVQFALEALRETGLPADSEVWRRAVVFLSRCQNRSESNDMAQISAGVAVGDDGGFMYDPALDMAKSEPETLPDGKVRVPSYSSVTYAGLMSLLYANVGRDDPRVEAAYEWLRANYTLEENRGLGSRRNPQNAKQGLYYFYHAFAKALSAWGASEIETTDGTKHRWAEELIAKLASLQKPEGYWVNEVPRWWEDQPVLVTPYCLLALDIAVAELDKAEGGPKPAE